MPRYDMRNKKTGRVFEVELKIAERGQYLLDHPNIEQVLTPVAFQADVVKVDSGFKEVLNKVHTRTPGSRLNQTAEF